MEQELCCVPLPSAAEKTLQDCCCSPCGAAGGTRMARGGTAQPQHSGMSLTCGLTVSVSVMTVESWDAIMFAGVEKLSVG